MLLLKAENLGKVIFVAIGATLLCIGIFIPWLSALSGNAVISIEKTWLSNCQLRLLASLLIPAMISYGISGFLIAVTISFISRSTQKITTLIAIVFITIINIILLSQAIIQGAPWSFNNDAQVILGFSWILEFASLWVCAFLGIWLMERKSRKRRILKQIST